MSDNKERDTDVGYTTEELGRLGMAIRDKLEGRAVAAPDAATPDPYSPTATIQQKLHKLLDDLQDEIKADVVIGPYWYQEANIIASDAASRTAALEADLKTEIDQRDAMCRELEKLAPGLLVNGNALDFCKVVVKQAEAALATERERLAERAEYATKLINELSWALDLQDMYDRRLIQLGDPKEKVCSAVHIGRKFHAREVLEGAWQELNENSDCSWCRAGNVPLDGQHKHLSRELHPCVDTSRIAAAAIRSLPEIKVLLLDPNTVPLIWKLREAYEAAHEYHFTHGDISSIDGCKHDVCAAITRAWNEAEKVLLSKGFDKDLIREDALTIPSLKARIASLERQLASKSTDKKHEEEV